MNLIEQVLDLDANAKKGPWDYRKDHTGDCDVNMFAADETLVAMMFFGAEGFEEAELVKVYRTAAPKLARALKDISGALPDTSAMRSCVVDFEQSYAADDDAKYWRDMAQNLAGSVDGVEDAINRVRMILAEIEKELST